MYKRQIHGLGIARSQTGWYVEAYCECTPSEYASARRAVAAHVGVGLSPNHVRIVPCAGFTPLLGAGDSVAHAVLAAGNGYGTLGGYASDLVGDLLLAVSNNHVFVNNNQATPPDDLVDLTTAQTFGGLHRFWPLVPQPGVNDLDAGPFTVRRAEETAEMHRFPTAPACRVRCAIGQDTDMGPSPSTSRATARMPSTVEMNGSMSDGASFSIDRSCAL